MTHDDASRRITVVGWLFFAFGWLTAVKIGVDLLHGHVNLDFGVLGIWIGRGLFRRQTVARTWALVMLFLELAVGFVLLLLVLAWDLPLQVNVLGMHWGPTTSLVAIPAAAAGAALTAWQIWVLMDPAVKAQFVAVAPVEERG